MSAKLMEQRAEALREFYEGKMMRILKCNEMGRLAKKGMLTDQDKFIVRECFMYTSTTENFKEGFTSEWGISNKRMPELSDLELAPLDTEHEARINNLREFHTEPEFIKKGICYMLGMNPKSVPNQTYSADIENECKKITRLYKEFRSGYVFR